jgi:hypothetical protein
MTLVSLKKDPTFEDSNNTSKARRKAAPVAIYCAVKD